MLGVVNFVAYPNFFHKAEQILIRSLYVFINHKTYGIKGSYRLPFVMRPPQTPPVEGLSTAQTPACLIILTNYNQTAIATLLPCHVDEGDICRLHYKKRKQSVLCTSSIG